MANHKPLKLDNNEIQRFQTTDTIAIEHGGTGAQNASEARENLGLRIGTDVAAHSAQLVALSSVADQGMLVWDGTAFVSREIAAAANTRITVTNSSGVGGNITLDLASVGSASPMGWNKISVDVYGRVTGVEAVTKADVTSILGSEYAPLSGATFTGPVLLAADPTAPMHAVTKQYLDSVMTSGGIPPFEAVRVKAPGNIGIAVPGAAIDGVTLQNGDRILLANQDDATENGIWVFNGAANALTRAEDANDSSEFSPARQVFVQQGTIFGNTGWGVGNTAHPTINTDAISFTQMSGAATYSAGSGLSLTGTQFTVQNVAGETTVSGSGVGLADSGVAAGTYSRVTVDVKGRVTAGGQVTAADLGAQPAHTTLTSLAAYNSNGFLVQTSQGQFVSRTINGTSGQITVANGGGTGGNPVISLSDSGVAPGTYNSVTVDAKGRVTAGTQINASANIVALTNGHSTALSAGRAVYSSGNNTVRAGLANNVETSKIIGITGTAINASAQGDVYTSGIIELSTGVWDAVTSQSGGLTPGAQYYLSNLTDGALTTSAPTSGVHAPVGIALSPTKFKVDPQRIVIL